MPYPCSRFYVPIKSDVKFDCLYSPYTAAGATAAAQATFGVR